MEEQKNSIAVFGGGCFWCTEAAFSKLRGVISVTPGYAGGAVERPRYEQVCSGSTGHAEVIQIAFDPTEIGYRDLLGVFFAVHDPTTKNQQGNDIGTQYRSMILYTNKDQRQQAESFIQQLEQDGTYQGVVTKVAPLQKFWEAEERHHKYYEKNPDQAYCVAIISPKLKKLRQKYASLIKSG